METVADVIIDDAEVCALLDSGATADLMSSAYAEARGFDVRPRPQSGIGIQFPSDRVC